MQYPPYKYFAFRHCVHANWSMVQVTQSIALHASFAVCIIVVLDVDTGVVREDVVAVELDASNVVEVIVFVVSVTFVYVVLVVLVVVETVLAAVVVVALLVTGVVVVLVLVVTVVVIGRVAVLPGSTSVGWQPAASSE
jgi:hypothetical protein